ncbi:MAG: PEP-CTERM sorting domain-containing protein [Deltaproteobacteria bacterium]|nr:PEP-CTERM sorting domain-containing protein [Deltaproteobacteria bacterium]
MKSIFTVLALSSVLAFAPYAYAEDGNLNNIPNGNGNNENGGNHVSVPEPSTMLLLGAAVAGLAARKLKKRDE